ncbi:uncharacterized protein EI97DRAFT_461476 [Westerdykella ornata]|uniref:Uncharacterized protein n=1 Tax=Westerdykella ornata TaxID=318751 RepID=A0A6A6J900_WESOR|nr:uncharacterized protein EI97DRAFT_461476 [Westerdykella ornata]KAF2273040.1 hypothetical protein EI97DRAFT_461476 [Westerdykella ornata]
MLPALQPSRPKQPQPTHPHHPSYTQTRALHDSASSQHQSPRTSSNSPSTRTTNQTSQSQTHTMPTRPTPYAGSYNSAIRHPVFFTSQLRKLPFPVPQVGSLASNPVASGYVEERRRDMSTGTGTKL